MFDMLYRQKKFRVDSLTGLKCRLLQVQHMNTILFVWMWDLHLPPFASYFLCLSFSILKATMCKRCTSPLLTVHPVNGRFRQRSSLSMEGKKKKQKKQIKWCTSAPTGSVVQNVIRWQPSFRGWWMCFGGGFDSQTCPRHRWALKRQ